MGKKFSGCRPENQPMFTRPDDLDFEKRRLFFAVEYSLAPPANPTVIKVGRTVTFTVAASDAPGNVRAQADYICDGTDDHVQIQAAIDALPADGGKIVLSQGTFNIESSIVLDSYQTLQGFGRSTILTTTTADLDIITATGSSGSEKIGILLADFCIDGDAGSATNDCGIIFEYVDYSTIQNVYSQDNPEMGIFLLRSDHNKIIGCVLQGNVYGIFLDVSTYNNIFDNTCVANITADIYIEDASDHNTISGNTCEGTVGVWLYDSCNNTIVANTFAGNDEEGIMIQTNSDGNAIVGNTCKGNGLDGILVDSSHNNSVIGNTCDDNDYYGISIASGNHNIIEGNSCRGNSQETDNIYDNIYVSGDYNLILGNLCRDGGEAKQPKYGIYVAGGTGNKVINNDLYDAGKTADFNDAGTGTIYVEPGIDDTPVDGQLYQPISSNWAHDHVATGGHSHMIWDAGVVSEELTYDARIAFDLGTSTQRY